MNDAMGYRVCTKGSVPLPEWLDLQANNIFSNCRNSANVTMLATKFDKMKLSMHNSVVVGGNSARHVRECSSDGALAKELERFVLSDVDTDQVAKPVDRARMAAPMTKKRKRSGSNDIYDNYFPTVAPASRRRLACWKGKRHIRSRSIGLAPVPKVMRVPRKRRAISIDGCRLAASVKNTEQHGRRVLKCSTAMFPH